jgi:hypothetical protein
MTTEEILADELLDRTQGSDLTIDELLALLAYAAHQETSPLMETRSGGADIGSVGQHAYSLKQKARTALC